MRKSASVSSNIHASGQKGGYLSRPRSSSVDRQKGSLIPLRRSASVGGRGPSGGLGIQFQRQSPAPGRPSVNNILMRSRAGSLLDSKRTIKDPRPLSDRNYQNKCIHSLVEFLTENNFPSAINAKMLYSPSKKDFEKIFEFLYKWWDPRYEVRKIEEEVPRIMKNMRYPFIINKSSLLTVGSRLTWPTLLGVLMWLVGLNKFAMNLDAISYFSVGDFENAEMSGIILKYILQCYSSGVDQPEKDEEVFREFITKRCSVDATVEELEAELDKKCMIKENLEEKIELITKLREENKELEFNLAQYDDYFKKMEKHKLQTDKECLLLKDECAKKNAELEDIQRIVAEKEAIYREQGFDGQQAQNFLLLQKDKLVRELDQKSQNVKQIEKKYWEEEIKFSQLSDKLASKCQELNNLYSDLRAIIGDAVTPLKNVDLPGAKKILSDFKVELPEFQITVGSYPGHYRVWNEEVKPAIDSAREYLWKQKDHVKKLLSVQEHYMHELEIKMSDINIKQQLVTAQSTQQERELDVKGKQYEMEISALESELARTQNEIEKTNQKRLAAEKRIAECKKEIQEVLHRKEIQDAEHEKYREASKKFLNQVLADTVEAYEAIEAVKKKTDIAVEKILKILDTPPAIFIGEEKISATALFEKLSISADE